MIKSRERDEYLPPLLFPNHPGPVPLAGQVLGEEDISFLKHPFLTASHPDFHGPVDHNNIFPADHAVPWVFITRRDLPEEDRLGRLRQGKKAKVPPGLKRHFNIFEMRLVVGSGIESRDPHAFFPDPILYLKTGKTHAFSHATIMVLPVTTGTTIAPKIAALMLRKTDHMVKVT